MDPLLKKLQWKAGPVAVLGAPEELEPALASWRLDGLTVVHGHVPGSAMVIAFVRARADVEAAAAEAVATVADGGLLWFAYPKKSSKRYRSDVTRDNAWGPLGELGYEPVRQVAVDDDWSALRFRRAEEIGRMARPADARLSEAGRARAAQDGVTG